MVPDQDRNGTLFFPTAVALVAGAPHPGPARKLVDYLLSHPVEQKLIDLKFARYSVTAPDPGVRPLTEGYDGFAPHMREAGQAAMKALDAK